MTFLYLTKGVVIHVVLSLAVIASKGCGRDWYIRHWQRMYVCKAEAQANNPLLGFQSSSAGNDGGVGFIAG